MVISFILGRVFLLKDWFLSVSSSKSGIHFPQQKTGYSTYVCNPVVLLPNSWGG
jgi:hypothetical protein